MPPRWGRCLAHPSRPRALVDVICFSVGPLVSITGMSSIDWEVCGVAMRALLDAIAARRASPESLSGRPHIIALSSTGLSDLGRDVPLAMVPLYHVLLKKPHEDKRAMEKALFASTEPWTIIRPSLLRDGPEASKPIRAGMEDPAAGTVDSKALGYFISREDVGKWIFENVLRDGGARWINKVASITT